MEWKQKDSHIDEQELFGTFLADNSFSISGVNVNRSNTSTDARLILLSTSLIVSSHSSNPQYTILYRACDDGTCKLVKVRTANKLG